MNRVYFCTKLYFSTGRGSKYQLQHLVYLRLVGQVDTAPSHDVEAVPNLWTTVGAPSYFSYWSSPKNHGSHEEKLYGCSNLTLASIDKVSRRNQTGSSFRSHLVSTFITTTFFFCCRSNFLQFQRILGISQVVRTKVLIF